MKMELTAKDIKLLKVMLTLLAVVLMFQFLIFPAVEKHQELIFEKEEMELKQEEMRYSIEGIDTTRALVEKTEKNLQDLSAPYYGLMEPREVDAVVTGLAYKHNLFPSRLDMGERMNSTLAPYLYSKDGEKEQKNTAGQEQKEETEDKKYVQSMEAEILLLGAEQDVLSLLDDIERNYPSIQVRSFDISRAAYMNTSMNLVEETKTNLVLTIYMCDKPGEGQ